jgi:hypothetical protein
VMRRLAGAMGPAIRCFELAPKSSMVRSDALAERSASHNSSGEEGWKTGDKLLL